MLSFINWNTQSKRALILAQFGLKMSRTGKKNPTIFRALFPGKCGNLTLFLKHGNRSHRRPGSPSNFQRQADKPKPPASNKLVEID